MDMRVEMCIDYDMCLYRYLHIGVDTCIDIVYIDMCIPMCMHIHVDMCIYSHMYRHVCGHG